MRLSSLPTAVEFVMNFVGFFASISCDLFLPHVLNPNMH